MKKLCDLHAHSTASDGSFTPTQLVQLAKEIGLAAVVLSDHNTVGGLPEFMEAAEVLGVEGVPAVEFSTEYNGVELHIIAMFVQPQYYETIAQMMEDFKRRKEKSNIDLVFALQKAGIPLDYDRIREGHSYVNRAHIGQELTRLGYTESVQEAFKTYLSPKRGYYVPPRRQDALETIAFIRSIGAVSVLAHPFLELDEAGLREFLPKAIEQGLDAMETLYSKFDKETESLAISLAEEFGLLQSGGSDFHGTVKPDIALGKGRGEMEIPYEFLEKLKARRNLKKPLKN